MAGRKTTTAKVVTDNIETNEDGIVVESPIIPKDVDPTTIITVKNGFHGKLVYTSSRTHEVFRWDSFGDEQEMELRELRNAKSSQKKFFENNWFMFDEANSWVIPYLGLNNYYKYAINLEDFDKIFSKTPEEVKKIIANMTKGQQSSVAYRARQLVKDGDIDSRKMIVALEEALGIELIEH